MNRDGFACLGISKIIFNSWKINNIVDKSTGEKNESRKELSRKYKRFVFPKNIVLEIDSKIEWKKIGAYGARRPGRNPVSLNSNNTLGFIKLAVFSRRFSRGGFYEI